MRKVSMLVAAAALVAVPVAGVAKPGGGTMPAQSAFGLCKAYFSGSDTGRANKRNAPPFRDLTAKAEAQDQTVEEFCAAQTPGNKGKAPGSASSGKGGRP